MKLLQKYQEELKPWRSASPLPDFFLSLLGEYGPQHWWPGDSPFETAIGAILTQNTSWTNVEKAIANLRHANMLDAASMNGVDAGFLEEFIRPSGYFRQKSKKLKTFCTFLAERYDGEIGNLKEIPLCQAREELLSIKGIGPETADSILLYALEFPIFVVDAYTVRIVDRWFNREAGTWTYDELQTYFMDRLPHSAELFNEYHALLVRFAKESCTKREPGCCECFLIRDCKYGEMSLTSEK
ncbi:MAG: endonuclease III domain-containing protein [Deltaproteobacteria bacterium]|nr:endonuclease III domain-containing protein [Deltaproteobacteria bacterium]